ncbi:dual specificity mitogen-activated protein kinase kinase 7-like isoform X2 [Prorops nasuta]|uniref:dual specificity mitogen-activated protein kinase kinase 7-like isoform X2 n=1 Tax=Prorops nasuta TaxID=863751 RepID=UPI0034CFE695
MSSTLENKILNLQERLRAENESRERDRHNNEVGSVSIIQSSSSAPTSSPALPRPRQLGEMGTPTRPRRQLNLPVSQMIPPKTHDSEFESKLQEIMKMNGILNINGQRYQTEMNNLEHLGELGNGTCGHVVKMRHKPSGVVIAVKQMRRSGNTEENKRIIMDLDVVLKSHDCPYIVQCLGCFITESDVWICMELMATCLDKLLKKSRQAIPEDFLGKVTLATVKALSYLKEKHGVIHRDVKPSNILLDESGDVKLCDFGISGRLVDSKAKTRSAGCAAYMAPERIDPPDPTKPDYDIRADVWSLGITLVELATGIFPYRDCKTDFEVLSRVVQDDPPSLPADAIFSKEFRNFVNCCLTKNYKHRPKYHKLMEHPFIRKYEIEYGDGTNSMQSSGYQWFGRVMRQLEPRATSGGQQRNTGHVSLKQTVYLRGQTEVPPFLKSNVHKDAEKTTFVPFHQRSNSENNASSISCSPYMLKRRDVYRPFSPPSTSTTATRTATTTTTMKFFDKESDGVDFHSRLFSPYKQSTNQAHDYHSNLCAINGQARHERYGYQERDDSTAPRSLSPFARDYSPWRRENVDPPGVVPANCESGRYSPFVQQRLAHLSSLSKSHAQAQDIYGSPMISRKRFPSEPPPPAAPPPVTSQSVLSMTPQSIQGSHISTSPQLLISRFAHQLKQEPSSPTYSAPQSGTKESAKKRFASYVRLRLGSERAPSPEPPPRLNRGESPLAIRRSLIEQPSPSYSRRYVSPSPPQPPPRRLSDSNSLPGSPQYVRARLRYTPEPQRRPPPP